jgi:hypothetical protein
MNLALTEEETAALLRELDGIIDGDHYFLSSRIKTLKAILARLRLERVCEPSPPPKRYEAPRATAGQSRRAALSERSDCRAVESLSEQTDPTLRG